MGEKWIAIRADYMEVHNMRGRTSDGSMMYAAQEEGTIAVHDGTESKKYEIEKGATVHVFGNMVHIPIMKDKSAGNT